MSTADTPGKILRRALAPFVVATLFLSPLVPAFSQRPAPAPQPPPRQRPEPDEQDDEPVKVSSNLVQVDAVVLDNRGRQVTNLKATDFEIIEEGRARRPEFCAYVPVTGGPNEAAPATDGRLAANELRRSIVFVVSNPVLEIKNNFFREDRPFETTPATLFAAAAVVDAQASAKVLEKFVEQQMGPHDLAAIRESEGGSATLGALTTDRAALRRAVERVRRDPLKKAPKVTIIVNGASNVIFEPWVEQNLGVIRMMSEAVDQLERLPGRRVLVLLSRGMLYNHRALGAEKVRAAMHELIAKANKARVTLYTLNPRGPDVANLRGGGFQDSGGLMILARETGGRAVFNQNDLAQGFADVLEDNRGYYLLGYNPGPEATARPHDIQVRVRRPGLRVQARRTAYAGAAATALRGPVSRDQLGEVVGSPLAFREMPLRLTPLFLSPDGRGARIVSLVNIDLANAERETREDGSQALKLDVVGRVTAPDGRVVYQKGRAFSLDVPRADLERTLARGIDYWFDLEADAPGHYHVSVAVRDAASGRVGNATQFVEVADLSSGRLNASSLFLSTAVEDGGAPPSFVKDDGLSAFSRREFPAGGTLRYQCYVYQARRESPSGLSKLQVQVAIRRDGAEQAVIPARAVNETSDPVLVGGDISLAGLSPGRYTLEVTINDLLTRTARVVASSDFQITK